MPFFIKPEVIIFDFDGVIVESNGIKDQVFKQIFSLYPEYKDDLWNYHKEHVSLSRYAKFDYLLGKLGKQDDKSLKEKLLSDFSTETLRLMKSVEFVSGAREALLYLSKNIPLYLASVTPIHDLIIILDYLEIRSFFKDVYGCPPWNKPDAVRDIMQKERSEGDAIILIGDSSGDQLAAKEAGIRFIGRDSGLSFENPQPEIIIPDLLQLNRILES